MLELFLHFALHFLTKDEAFSNLAIHLLDLHQHFMRLQCQSCLQLVASTLQNLVVLELVYQDGRSS